MFRLKLVLLLLPLYLNAQIITNWQTFPNAPFGSRINDASFVDEDYGWVVRGAGEGFRTTDGGDTWEVMLNSDSTFWRSVTFANKNLGFAGNLGPDEYGGSTITDPNLIYRTSDGGINWAQIYNITGETGKGVCGIQALDSLNIYAVGRVRGPSVFIKSTDGGDSWLSMNMSLLAAGLVDVHFFTPDSGIAIGLSNSEHALSSGVVLFTSDGGSTWTQKYLSSRQGEWCWKISFPSRNTGYVSLQRNVGSPVNFIKTTDGGNTWFEKQFFETAYYVQGIGFANDTLGWIGGNGSQTTYRTTDGGETWEPANFGSRINRFFFVNEFLGYAGGQTVYKYTGQIISSVNDESKPAGFQLSQNYPNPFNPSTKIRFTIPRLTPTEGGSNNGILYVTLKIYDSVGKEVMTLVDEQMRPGENEIEFFANNLASGVYYYQLQAGDPSAGSGHGFIDSKKMILIK
jgi:photosystem II stability/assembly factor-like uncharacterized protein